MIGVGCRSRCRGAARSKRVIAPSAARAGLVRLRAAKNSASTPEPMPDEEEHARHADGGMSARRPISRIGGIDARFVSTDCAANTRPCISLGMRSFTIGSGDDIHEGERERQQQRERHRDDDTRCALAEGARIEQPEQVPRLELIAERPHKRT